MSLSPEPEPLQEAPPAIAFIGDQSLPLHWRRETERLPGSLCSGGSVNTGAATGEGGWDTLPVGVADRTGLSLTVFE